MKKTLMLVLSSALLLGLVACGTPSADRGDTSKETQLSTEQETGGSDETGTETKKDIHFTGIFDLRLPAIFANNMVLQRGKPVPIWGWNGTPGEKITATIGQYSAECVVDDEGNFYMELPAMEGASGQLLNIVKEGGGAKTYRGVGIGEVWYCSGQSNMELKISSTFDTETIKQGAGKYDVRSFKVTVEASYTPKQNVNGSWKQITSSNVDGVSAVAYVAAYQLQKELNVPVAIIECYEGGSCAQAWLSYEALFAEDRADIYNNPDWVVTDVRNNWGCEGRTIWQDYDYYWSRGEIYDTTKKAGTLVNGVEGSQGSRFAPTGLYNAMQAPLANYAIAGVMWYQGESQPNARLADQYNYILFDLIEQWREDFRDEDLPVMLVQLAPYDAGNGRNFFEIRQVQIDTAKRLENVGVISTAYEGTLDSLDTGGAIHPGTKVPVGDRMANTILGMVYGRTGEYSGPMYEYMEVKGDSIVLHFSHLGGGLAIKQGDTKLTGFRISADGKAFVAADATIVGDTVVVSSSRVKSPVAVTYAYVNVHPLSGTPDTLGGNLENQLGQPAFPFIATLGNAVVHDGRVVDKMLAVEIWEQGHTYTEYQVEVTVGSTTKSYEAKFNTAGNCIVVTDFKVNGAERATVTLKDAQGKLLQTRTITVFDM